MWKKRAKRLFQCMRLCSAQLCRCGCRLSCIESYSMDLPNVFEIKRKNNITNKMRRTCRLGPFIQFKHRKNSVNLKWNIYTLHNPLYYCWWCIITFSFFCFFFSIFLTRLHSTKYSNIKPLNFIRFTHFIHKYSKSSN